MTFLLTTEYTLLQWFGGNWELGKGREDGWGSHHVVKKADSNMSIPRISSFLRA